LGRGRGTNLWDGMIGDKRNTKESRGVGVTKVNWIIGEGLLLSTQILTKNLNETWLCNGGSESTTTRTKGKTGAAETRSQESDLEKAFFSSQAARENDEKRSSAPDDSPAGA